MNLQQSIMKPPAANVTEYWQKALELASEGVHGTPNRKQRRAALARFRHKYMDIPGRRTRNLVQRQYVSD